VRPRGSEAAHVNLRRAQHRRTRARIRVIDLAHEEGAGTRTRLRSTMHQVCTVGTHKGCSLHEPRARSRDSQYCSDGAQRLCAKLLHVQECTRVICGGRGGDTLVDLR